MHACTPSPGIYSLWKSHFPRFPNSRHAFIGLFELLRVSYIISIQILMPWVWNHWNQQKAQRKVFSSRAESFLWADVAVGLCCWRAKGIVSFLVICDPWTMSRGCRLRVTSSGSRRSENPPASLVTVTNTALTSTTSSHVRAPSYQTAFFACPAPFAPFRLII